MTILRSFSSFCFITQKGIKIWPVWKWIFSVRMTARFHQLNFIYVHFDLIKMSVQFWQWFLMKFANPRIFLYSEITQSEHYFKSNWNLTGHVSFQVPYDHIICCICTYRILIIRPYKLLAKNCCFVITLYHSLECFKQALI